jgi:acyl-coenzyme A thioesterase PaaI-like protein
MAKSQNRMSRIAASTQRLPAALRRIVLSRLFARIVPFLGTAGLVFEDVNQEKVVVSAKNRRKIQNHIKGVHAATMALLAETASGFVMGMNVPDDKLMLLKSMHVDYLKRSQGDMRATATLTPEQISAFFNQDKGEVDVKVIVTDESGEAPIRCQMIWAWIPKKRN